MKSTVTDLLTAALDYAARDWHIFPCHTPTADGCSCRRDCGRLGKHPRTKNGLHDATTDPATIRRWWKMWPKANLAVRTGTVSGLVVLDQDTVKGGNVGLQELEHMYSPLPETVQSLTGTGIHYVFAHPGTPVKNGVETLGPGLDIRGDGGYVIVPPSLHASGKRYAWELSHLPEETALAPMPAWLLALCQDTTRREAPRAGDPIPQGRRNSTLFQLGCSLRARGCTEAVILAALRAMNATQCQPPLDEEEVRTIAASCATYSAGQAREDAQQRRNGSDASPEVAQAQDDTKLPYSDVYNPLPTIEITTKMEDIVDSTEAAIRVLPHGPHLFQRARQLVCIARTAPAPKWLRRPAEMPVIMTATLAHVRELASMAATWEKYDKRSHALEPALPPPWVAETLRDRGGWKFPVLEGIVSTPTLLPDGSILDRPGYDQETGLFVALDRPYPPVPLRPTFDDARSALGILQQPFTDFLFDDTSPANFSATLAALLTVLCRYAIQGDVPLFAVTATTRRSGKGLLVDVISTIATGRTAPRWAQPHDRDGDEERKRMLAIGLAGDPLILIDNLTRPLGSEALDIALTCQGTFADRTLGTHQTKEAPMHAVFFATGNNITYKADTAPRVVPIALDPKMERPEERTGFQQDDLRAWVRHARPRLVTAALTLMRAYFEAGCPQQGITPMGGFEAWSALVRQALGWAGEADPLAGQKTLALEHDTGSENLRSLLVSWETCYKG